MIKILVVEDSKKDMLFYKNVLENIENIEVFYALSGEEALGILRENDFNIFILDIELPGMNGLELASRIRNIPRYSLKLIMFITGYEKNQLEAFKQYHCYDYIIKPFSAKELDKKIRKLIKSFSIEKEEKTKIKMLLYPTINKELLIPINQIKYAEASHRSCYLYTDLQEEPIKSNNIILKELIAEVDDPYFIQCYRSFAVNVKKIQEIEQLNYRLWTITLKNSKNKLYVSSKYFSSIEEKLKLWNSKKKG